MSGTSKKQRKNTSLMKKRSEANAWCTIDDAAIRLSENTGTTVTRGEVLRYIVQESLKLYWYIPFGKAGTKAALKDGKRSENELKNYNLFQVESKNLIGPCRIPLQKNLYIREMLLCQILSMPKSDHITLCPLVVEDDDGVAWYVSELASEEQHEIIDLSDVGVLKFIIRDEPDYSALVVMEADLADLVKPPEEMAGKRQFAVAKIDATLSKIVIGIAKEAYGYDLKNTDDKASISAVSRIYSDLIKAGFLVDRTTIKNRLGELAEEYTERETPET